MSACLRCAFDPDATISASWSFFIDREIKSGNSHIVNAAVTRFAYKRTRDAWQWEFRAVRQLQGIPSAAKKRRVTLTRIYAGRCRAFDRDNLATGCKVVVDALVLEGLLVDDDVQSAEIHYDQRKGDQAGVVVLIEEFA